MQSVEQKTPMYVRWRVVFFPHQIQDRFEEGPLPPGIVFFGGTLCVQTEDGSADKNPYPRVVFISKVPTKA